MIDQLFEFVGNHYLLVGLFVALVIAFLINEGKQSGASIGTSNLVQLINRQDAVIVDVRDHKEFSQGHIAGAVNIPFSSLDQRAPELEEYKEKPVVVVCKMGQQAGAAGRKLKAKGFKDVRRLSGGMSEWTSASLPLVK